MTHLSDLTYAAMAERAVRRVLPEVTMERMRQVAKWGKQRHPHAQANQSWAYRLGLADWARDQCDKAAREARLTWQDILLEEVYEALAERDLRARRTELIQVMAVCAAEIEQIDEKLEGRCTSTAPAPGSTETADVRLA